MQRWAADAGKRTRTAERTAGARARDGRERLERWGPRIIDLDLVWMVDAAVEEPDLTVPHPGVSMRNFVLYPLGGYRPDGEIPGQRDCAGSEAQRGRRWDFGSGVNALSASCSLRTASSSSRAR